MFLLFTRGVVLCLISGACYGVNFAPVIYIKDNYVSLYGYNNCTKEPCIEDVSSKGEWQITPTFSLISPDYMCVLLGNQALILD